MGRGKEGGGEEMWKMGSLLSAPIMADMVRCLWLFSLQTSQREGECQSERDRDTEWGQRGGGG